MACGSAYLVCLLNLCLLICLDKYAYLLLMNMCYIVLLYIVLEHIYLVLFMIHLENSKLVVILYQKGGDCKGKYALNCILVKMTLALGN